MWAVSTLMTRQNTIPSEDGSTIVNVLIPLWDMCNHTNGEISTDFNPSLQRSECLAMRDFKAGEQLFIFYGPRTTADLFIHNGFVYDDNEHDGYSLTLGVSPSDRLCSKRTQLLEKLALKPTTTFILKKCAEPISSQLLAFLRIFNMNEEQLQHWLDSEKSCDLEFIDCALETSLEKKSWSFLQTRLTLMMTAYKTSLDEDEALVQDDKRNYNALLAIKMRATEKRILKCALEYAEQRINQ